MRKAAKGPLIDPGKLLGRKQTDRLISARVSLCWDPTAYQSFGLHYPRHIQRGWFLSVPSEGGET